MDKVTILSRKKYLAYIPPLKKEDIVSIRISDHKPKVDIADKRYSDTLYLEFYDLETPIEDLDRRTPDGSNRINDKDKAAVDAFIDKHRDKTFVVHCEQGRSRSAAVGYYILMKLNETRELDFKRSTGALFP